MTDTVFEFRNYTLHPGQRDVLIDMFERHFTESQEEGGSHVLGTFRNLDDPDRFVWIRSFTDMETRRSALNAFYTGPVWQELRNAANATMIDSDDVLQLKRVSGALPWRPESRPPIAAAPPASLIVATTYFLAAGDDETFAALFAEGVAPVLHAAGVDIVATLATDHRPNSYPRLPVRENETVFIALTRFASAADYDGKHSSFEAPALARHFIKPPETLRLQPTARSLLR